MTSPLGSSDLAALTRVAAVVVDHGTRPGDPGRRVDDEAVVTDPVRRPGASFVTLERSNEPAGCKGSLRPRRPLWIDVAVNARRAAFEDQRYPPVVRDQLQSLTIRVSVLAPLEEIPAPSIDVLAAALRPGVDGLLLTAEGRGAVFLPHVWGRHPAPEDFVAALVRKAGWPRLWLPGAKAWRYTTRDVTGRCVDSR